jgi:hypothetical protein
LSLPHADNITAPVVRILNAAPNRLSFNSIPLIGTDEMIAAGVAAARRTAVVLAVVRHRNNDRPSATMPRDRWTSQDSRIQPQTGGRNGPPTGSVPTTMSPPPLVAARPTPRHRTLTSVGKSLN